MPTLCKLGSYFWPLDSLQFHSRAVIKLDFTSCLFQQEYRLAFFFCYFGGNRELQVLRKEYLFSFLHHALNRL